MPKETEANNLQERKSRIDALMLRAEHGEMTDAEKADITLEIHAIMADVDRDEFERGLVDGMEKDIGPFSKSLDYLNGVIHGAHFVRGALDRHVAKDPSILQQIALVTAVAQKIIQRMSV